MYVHLAVSEIINNQVLRDVIRIPGMDIPYPAELWVEGQQEHEHGTAMFSISGGGFLRAEYFGYDNDPGERWWRFMGPGRNEGELVMKDTGVKSPIRRLAYSPKNLISSDVSMSEAAAYEGLILGHIGDPYSEMQSVTMTISGLPNVHLGRVTTPVPDESTNVESISLHGFKRMKGGLDFEAGEWRIGLWESYQVDQTAGRPLHFVNISRKDGKPFFLGDDINTGIIGALRKFLSFQCAGLITIPTAICHPVRIENEVAIIKSAWVGQLSSREESSGNPLTATDVEKWPSLFEEFWNLYSEEDSSTHLINALYHYQEAERVYKTGSIGQALVAAQSTLQALARWWNDKPIEFKFGPPGITFDQLLPRAVAKAELGKDSGREIDQEALKDAIEKARRFRNDIDHGRGINIERNIGEVVALRMHHQDLARMLILAKLGTRYRDARGNMAGPKFTEQP